MFLNVSSLIFECKCPKCELPNSTEVELSDVSFDCVSSDERGMGPELEHSIEEPIHFECECGNEYNAYGSVW